MNGSRTQRITALGGAAYVVLALAAIFQKPLMDLNNSPADVRAFLEDGPRTAVWVGAMLYFLAICALLAFAARLASEIRSAGADGQMMAAIVVSAAIASAALGLAATAAFGAAVDRPHGAPVTDAVILFDTGSIAHALANAVLGLLCVATGIVTLQTNVLPRWTAWLGFASAIVVVGGAAVLMASNGPYHAASAVLSLWLIVMSVILFRRKSETSLQPARTGGSS